MLPLNDLFDVLQAECTHSVLLHLSVSLLPSFILKRVFVWFMVCGCFYFLWFWHGSSFPLKEIATAYKNHLFAAGQQKFLSEDNKVGSTEKTEQHKCELFNVYVDY